MSIPSTRRPADRANASAILADMGPDLPYDGSDEEGYSARRIRFVPADPQIRTNLLSRSGKKSLRGRSEKTLATPLPPIHAAD